MKQKVWNMNTQSNICKIKKGYTFTLSFYDHQSILISIALTQPAFIIPFKNMENEDKKPKSELLFRVSYFVSYANYK